MKVDLKKNNMDWLRLAFALQVIIIHGLENLQNNYSSGVGLYLHHFPGVPAFFFLSGFLIYASFHKNPNLGIFFKNRFLRLFPGLFFVTIGALLLIMYIHIRDGYFNNNIGTYFLWFVSQITLGQAWNPGVFRDVGLGVINGALWTITVEILFYIAIPIIYWLETKLKHIVIVAFVVSFSLYSFGDNLFGSVKIGSKTLFDYLSLTPIIWGWMFILGTLAYKNIKNIERYFNYLFLGFPILFVLIYFDFGSSVFLASSGNRLGLIYFGAYCATILLLAFRTPFLNLKHDLSYGIYVWHMVVINMLIEAEIRSLLIMVFLTILLSIISWKLVERPMLLHKKSSLRALT